MKPMKAARKNTNGPRKGDGATDHSLSPRRLLLKKERPDCRNTIAQSRKVTPKTIEYAQ
jgi:hypothetical protein